VFIHHILCYFDFEDLYQKEQQKGKKTEKRQRIECIDMQIEDPNQAGLS